MPVTLEQLSSDIRQVLKEDSGPAGKKKDLRHRLESTSR